MERLDVFMGRAAAAYYAAEDPFRDFTTAPEISQVFGELLGAWAAAIWDTLGRPAPVILAEAGPGRGTLMADALRLIRARAPDFAAALAVHFIETSPRLRAIQAQAVPGATWHTDPATLPPGPLLLLANEFLDALPIREWEHTAAAWAERHVADGRVVLAPLADPPPPAPPGTIRQIPEAACAFVATIARRLAATGGAALFLDYGTEAPASTSSLQGVRHGVPANPLAHPGETDITAHVDFAAVAAAARAAGAATHGPVPQGVFLARLGLHPRTEALARANPARATALRDAADRLAAPARMGALFKALAIAHPGIPAPPGFEA